MSAELTKARYLINAVSTFLKQAKPMPAVNALLEALHIVLREPLIKSEKTEFTAMITNAVALLNHNDTLRTIYNLILTYQGGEERALLETLRAVSNTLKAEVVQEAREMLAALERRRADALQQGKDLLAAKLAAQAREVFTGLVKDFPDDSQLRADIAEVFMQFEYYEDAFNYLDQALDLSPNQIQLYNRIGIALRKLKRYDVAEKYFMRAVSYAKDDPNLYFNLGRVYVDWGRYDKAEKAASMALRLNPDFELAQKMLTYSLSKQDKKP